MTEATNQGPNEETNEETNQETNQETNDGTAVARAPASEPRAPVPDSSAYIQIWTDSFSQVIAQITGDPVPCRVSAAAPAESAPAEKAAAEPSAESSAEPTTEPVANPDEWIVVTSAGALRGEMRLRLSPPSVLRLGQAFMSEPAAPDSPLTPDHRESVVELLRQVSGVVASAAKARWGEVQLHV
ncbi:MAG: hypothetical protein WBM24_24215, partial [Candidatus Sulfotelmatobacter sp.]